MLKTLFVAFLMLVFSQNILSQGWQWINTGYNFILYDVSFPPGQSNVGYAVGSSSTYNGDGIILKTTDGGQSWFQISIGIIPGLEAVSFTSTEVGYAGGWQNYYIKTTDGGATWSQITIATDIWYFKEIEFWDTNLGIASAQDNIGVHVIYVTTDAGNTWTKSLNMNQGVEDICYVDQNTLYIAGGDEKISRSTDGGLNWTEVYSGIFQFMFFGVEFYNANYGIVGGEDGKVLVTTNGGTTWTTSNAGGYGLMSGVHIFNEDSAYVGGTPEQVYKTTNGGTTWFSDFNSGYNEAFYKIKFTENGTGIICSSGGKFLINTDYVPISQQQSYAFNGGWFSYGTIDLTTGLWTTMNFNPQGNNKYPVVADNKEADGQYSIMADFSYPTNYFLWHVNFATMSGDSIAPLGPLATGQTGIRGMAYNKVNDTWYVISSDEWVGTTAYLYTLDVTTGVLTQVGQIQNANQPVGMAIDCEGNAYIVNIVLGATGTAVLSSLNLTTAVATAIGTDLGLAMASTFAQDMDFDPSNGNLYWAGYWSDGWFAEGGSFRLVDVTTGTSTELAAYGQYENLFGFNVNATCTTVPVELASFSASVHDGIVKLIWSTATEINNSGFEIERKNVASDWQSLGFVPGHGTSTEPISYSFEDRLQTAGTYSYRLKQIDFDGSYEYSNEIYVTLSIPAEFKLAQNYPNPFNPSTTIEFSIPNNALVTLKVYNPIGEEVAVLVNGELPAGSHSIKFNASGLASGIYIVKMTAGSYSNVIKMNLLR